MDNLHKILKAIRKINPNAVMTIAGDDINTCSITWLEDTTPISKEDIKTLYMMFAFYALAEPYIEAYDKKFN